MNRYYAGQVPLRSPFRLDYPLNDGMLVAPAEAVVAWLDQVRFCFVDTTRPYAPACLAVSCGIWLLGMSLVRFRNQPNLSGSLAESCDTSQHAPPGGQRPTNNPLRLCECERNSKFTVSGQQERAVSGSHNKLRRTNRPDIKLVNELSWVGNTRLASLGNPPPASKLTLPAVLTFDSPKKRRTEPVRGFAAARRQGE